MEDRPAELLWAGTGEVGVAAKELEPPDEVCGSGDDHQPVPVRLEVREGEAAQPGVLQPCDVLLHVGMRTDERVKSDRVACLVGVEE